MKKSERTIQSKTRIRPRMRPSLTHPLLASLPFLLAACSSTPPIAPRSFGTMPDGREVKEYTLRNSHGMEAGVISYGGTMTKLSVPDKNGKFSDVLLGFDNLDDYRKKSPYFGALIGRYGNRIANGKFLLNGQAYKLATNNEPSGVKCSLHGGKLGYDKRVWTVTPGGNNLRLDYTSPAGEEGYPGTLHVTVHYTLTEDNVLRVAYEARADQDTVLNLTQHNYYNLAGEGSGTINGHQLTINADRFTPVDKGLIPTGAYQPVSGTPFDFTTPHTIGERVGAKNDQLKYGLGYDHNWVLNSQSGRLAQAGELYEPKSGRVMEVWTTQPGLQFYGGNFLDGTLTGKSGKKYKHRTALCLESQHYPDSPNQPNFPTTTLKAGQVFKSVTEYRFKTR
jgi:aldose 1-epimerase